MSNRIAVVGDKESIYGFAALGLDPYVYEEGEEGTLMFKKLCQNESYSIIYVTEAAAMTLDKEIEKYADILISKGMRHNTFLCIVAHIYYVIVNFSFPIT